MGIALYVLFLDKQAAFDSVLKEHVIAGAYTAAGYLMGPICDQRGVEQGGVNSGDEFQLVNREEQCWPWP